uniref:Uncharacterized protein n=1 Tax=Solanum tuberosum TaxID=4113 RepID=M1DSN0_SOLTU
MVWEPRLPKTSPSYCLLRPRGPWCHPWWQGSMLKFGAKPRHPFASHFTTRGHDHGPWEDRGSFRGLALALESLTRMGGTLPQGPRVRQRAVVPLTTGLVGRRLFWAASSWGFLASRPPLYGVGTYDTGFHDKLSWSMSVNAYFPSCEIFIVGLDRFYEV